MKCSKCGESDHAIDAIYCHICGNRLQKTSKGIGWKILLLILICLVVVASCIGIIWMSNDNNNDGSYSVNTNNDNEVENNVKSVINEFCKLSRTCDVGLVYKLYAGYIERYHDSYGISVDSVANCYMIYDSMFDVIGNKYSDVRWDTFSYEKVADRIYVTYTEDYSIERADNSKYSIFVIRKHIVMNGDYMIVSVYDDILERHKRYN
jgi:hypothetical protein